MLDDLGPKLRKQLIDTGMMDAVAKIANSTGLVNIDINDLKTFDNKKITSVIDYESDFPRTMDISILKVSDIKPTNAIIAIFSREFLAIDLVGQITAKIEEKVHCDLDIIMGSFVDPTMSTSVRVVGLLGANATWGDDETIPQVQDLDLFKEEASEKIIESEEVLRRLDASPKPQEVLKFPSAFDKELYYYSKAMIEKNLTLINQIQAEFDISFDKANKIMKALEEMKIISERGPNGRQFLMTNSRDIYNLICNPDKFETADDKMDKVYQAGQYVLATGDTTIAGIQARFNMSFGEAAGIIGKLEACGIVSVKNGINPRRVLVNNVHDVYLKLYNKNN